MKIIEVLTRVEKEEVRWFSNNYDEPKIVIYLSDDFYRECMAEISRELGVTSIFHELFYEGTMFGYPVYRVINIHIPNNKRVNRHPTFNVVNTSY